MKTSTLLAACAISASVLGLSACKDAGPATDDDTAGTNNGWLTGEWTGDFKDKNAPEDSALRDTTATATISSTDDPSNTTTSRRGDFKFVFPDQGTKGATVAGTIGDFQGKSVMLTATQTDLPAIFPLNRQVTLDYELVADSLELINDRIDLRLLRNAGTGTDATGGNSTSDGSGSATTSQFIGEWKCRDEKGYSWDVQIKYATAFSIEVKNPGVASLWLEGNLNLVTGDATRDADFNVVTSSDNRYVGVLLRAKMDGDNVFDLTRYAKGSDGSQQEAETFPCARS